MAYINPTGPYNIGSITHNAIDMSRPAHLAGAVPGRTLAIKVWYPCTTGAGILPERVWEDLRGDSRTPLMVRIMLKCLRSRTSTFRDARFDADPSGCRLVIYNHGLISFNSENSSLMEELASHGNVVLAIQHADQMAEFKALNGSQSSEKKRIENEFNNRLKRASPLERARLATAYYSTSDSTNRIVVERSLDTSFVLDHLSEVLGNVPGLDSNLIENASANLAGFSVGGAVSTETAKRDSRVRSVINMDGGMYGTGNGNGIRCAYLMMYSSANQGINDLLLPGHAARMTLPDSMHLNFHDAAMLLPFLRLFRQTGTANPKNTLGLRNKAVRQFISSLSLAPD